MPKNLVLGSPSISIAIFLSISMKLELSEWVLIRIEELENRRPHLKNVFSIDDPSLGKDVNIEYGNIDKKNGNIDF